MNTLAYPISSKEYASRNGDCCPYCDSKRVVSLGPVVPNDDGIGYHHIICQACRKKWYDQYRLVGFIPSK